MRSNILASLDIDDKDTYDFSSVYHNEYRNVSDKRNIAVNIDFERISSSDIIDKSSLIHPLDTIDVMTRLEAMNVRLDDI
jgi:hypothetical protein